MKSQRGQLPVGLIAQLVEHCTGIAEVTGLNPIQAQVVSGFNITMIKKLTSLFPSDFKSVFV